MAKKSKPTKKTIPAFVYRISNSGPNRRHIEIPSKDRPQFRDVSIAAVIPLDDCIRERLEKALGVEFKISLTNGVR